MERIGDTLTRMKLAEFSRRFPPEAPVDGSHPTIRPSPHIPSLPYHIL